MAFQTWSEINQDAQKELRPDFGLRLWGDIQPTDRNVIWQHMIPHFFEKKPLIDRNHRFSNEYGKYYPFTGNELEQDNKRKRIGTSIVNLSNKYKANNYAPKFLEDRTFNNACSEFYEIFIIHTEHVAIELLSLYAKAIIDEPTYYISKDSGESEKAYAKRKEEREWVSFDEFADDLNEILSQFGLNYFLTRQGFVPRVDKKIIEDIYVPVLKSLSNIKWKEVNTFLSESFAEYRERTPQGFGACITKSVTAVQAFLQILINGKTGKGDISKLIPEAQKKGLIPNDNFTAMIFKDIESVLMRLRQESSGVHPTKKDASEKNAMLVLNLSMVFFHHCLAE
jgi:hypothetical protein